MIPNQDDLLHVEHTPEHMPAGMTLVGIGFWSMSGIEIWRAKVGDGKGACVYRVRMDGHDVPSRVPLKIRGDACEWAVLAANARDFRRRQAIRDRLAEEDPQ